MKKVFVWAGVMVMVVGRLVGMAAEPVAPVVIETSPQGVRLANGLVSLSFVLGNGTYSVTDCSAGDVVLADAVVQSAGIPMAPLAVVSKAEVVDELGKGQRLVLKAFQMGLRNPGHKATHVQPPDCLFSFTLYEGRGAVVLGFGARMPIWYSSRLMDASPLAQAKLFPGKLITDPLTLNSSAGAEMTQVKPGLSRVSANGLMVTGIVGGKRRTVVMGGLGYQDFGKYAALRDGVLELRAEDPVGRLVDPEETYLPNDTFYLDVTTSEPFIALEQYGRAMRAVNHANPQVYDFLMQCAWGVGALCKLGNVNNSPKIIEQIEAARTCGILKYMKVGIQLVPDKKNADTEQGWWDDEHFVRYGHLQAPYETLVKWGEAMRARGGYPCLYVQTGMPSDDFARAFPNFMLFNDISRLDRPRLRPDRPYVTFDFTDPGFKKHMQTVWSGFRAAGIRSVMFDYPETGWRPEGGFEDRYATTASAYREIFRQAREGLGPDARLDERLLGEAGRPCLEITAGLVDVQRNWTDSKDYSAGMVTISGLRWYKNRTVYHYYPDTKTVHDLAPAIRQSMLTMMFLTSGRLNLGTSFHLFTPEITHDVSRIYPPNKETYAARPLDAFVKGRTDPSTYDLELTPDWHQVALFNPTQSELMLSLPLSGDRVADGAVGLSPHAVYYVYDFWSDSFLGKFRGDAVIEQKLQPLCCKMLSLRKVQPNPQVLSTDRHVLQGWVELSDMKWDGSAGRFSGVAKVIGGEPLKIVVANNGWKPDQGTAADATIRIEAGLTLELATLIIESSETRDVKWSVGFSK